MHVVYIGEKPHATLKDKEVNHTGLVYAKGVPTWCPKWLREAAGNSPDFKKWDGKTVHSTNPPTIQVIMPVQLDWFMAARRTVERIREFFPHCPIKAIVQPAHAHLLKGVQISSSLNSADQSKYYRKFDLRPSSNSRWLTDMHVRNHSMESLCMLFAGVFTVELGDKELKPNYVESKPGNGSVVIVGEGATMNETVEGLYQSLLEKCKKQGIKPLTINKYDPDFAKEQMELIDECSYVAFCCDSPLAIYAAYLRKPGFVFTRDHPASLSRKIGVQKWKQYSWLRAGDTGVQGNLIANMAGDGNVEKQAGDIVGLMKAALSGKPITPVKKNIPLVQQWQDPPRREHDVKTTTWESKGVTNEPERNGSQVSGETESETESEPRESNRSRKRRRANREDQSGRTGDSRNGSDGE